MFMQNIKYYEPKFYATKILKIKDIKNIAYAVY